MTSEPFASTTACGAVKYGSEKSTAFWRAGVIEIWLMSKSKFFGPGAYEELNGTTVHFTSSFEKPSFFATA